MQRKFHQKGFATYFEDHGTASLAVLELHVLSDEGTAIYKSCPEIVGLIDIL